MADTYSTNLALIIQATGSNSGSWGSETNTNIGTLIEQAISGYVTQAITDGSGANTTITIPNGATGVARNMCIEMTGALTFDTCSLIVPANKKLYFIYNNTTGGHPVTVKVTGLTGVSVPNGVKVLLVSNGTDIVSATSYMASLTLGSALAVGSGGSGAATFTANAALLGNGTSAFQAVAPGTAGNVLTSDGSTWGSAAGAVPSGTVMLFQQTAAPTGWTKLATNNDKALRVVSGTAGTGGSTGFTSVFGAGKSTSSYTLATADIPSHTHAGSTGTESASHTHDTTTGTESADHSHSGTTGATAPSVTLDKQGTDAIYTGAGATYIMQSTTGNALTSVTGTAASHTHSFSSGGVSATHTHSGTSNTESANHSHSFTSNATGGGGGHSHTLSLDLQYVDVIAASKN